MKTWVRFTTLGFAGVAVMATVYFLWWHFTLGLHRYFDVDELAHLHWASQIAMGRRPFIDFFSFFPPGYWWFLVPLVKLGWGTTAPLLSARIEEFVVFVLLGAVTGLVIYELRKNLVCFLVALLTLAFLPMPFDKFLEIRPDTLAVLFGMTGMLLQILAMQPSRVERVRKWLGVAAGVFFGVSLIVVTKALPQVVISLGVAFLWQRKLGKFIAIGIAAPVLLFGLWLISLGNFSLVLYSLTKLPIEANKLGTTFYMSPDLFFYPNEIFYGVGGYSVGLITNHVIWLVAMGFGLYRLLTPFFPSGRAGVSRELLVSGTFIMQIALYVLFYPLKHTQYLIPIAVFVAIFAGDLAGTIWQSVRRSQWGTLVGSTFGMLLIFFLIAVSRSINAPKQRWTNDELLSRLTVLYANIRPATYAFDPEGPLLYARDPYYICCLPFGQFVGFLSRPMPNLSDALEQTKTPYIYKGSLDRLSMLAADDQAYIRLHYRTSAVAQELLERIP